MAQIRILPETLSNKIAAGEVVERPASVVKELLENSLDAGATRILIDIEKGGHSFIQITDNGQGMDSDDALLSVERHATSKIQTDEDLFKISTLGFRGEALSSISSVSRFTLITKNAESDVGTQIDIEGGKLSSVKSVGAPVGTLIRVQDLFYNTPARRKFLKAISTEMAHIADMLNSLALAHPKVFFRLTHNKREVKTWSVAEAHARDRVLDVFGTSIQNRIYDFHAKEGEVKLHGWLVSSRHPKPSSKNIYIFVNGRYVRDRSILSAILQGYQGRLMKGEFPQLVLFLELPPNEVDVNVHPTKQEVRFLEQRKIYQLVLSVIAQNLQRHETPLWGNAPTPQDILMGRTTPSLPNFQKPASFSSKTNPGTQSSFPRSSQPIGSLDSTTVFFQKALVKEEEPILAHKKFSGLEIIGQFHNSYILAESSNGHLIIIDQHAAHERIVFEQLKEARKKAKIETQQLLMPETIELKFAQADLLEQNLSVFQKIGFDIEAFGGTTFLIKGIPSLLIGKQIEPVLVEILEKESFASSLETGEVQLESYLHVVACHSSIRGNQKLTMAEMKKLLEDMDRFDLSGNCPHGRPTWIEQPLAELEKAFRRT